VRYLTRLAAALALTLACAGTAPLASAQTGARDNSSDKARIAAMLDEGQRLYYSGQYERAAALAMSARESDPQSLLAYELRSSALHFQIRRALGTSGERDRAWKACASCPELMTAFLAETTLGRNAARERLAQNPTDPEAMFFLGKLDLNYVWLHLATLGRKTGWSEYWEARRTLDALLKIEPTHVRGRVARAWIDYIVATKVPRGVRWMVGGGNKNRGLEVVRQAAREDAPPFVQAEAMFALWDMQVREKKLPDAVVTARVLSREFPENRDVTKFLSTHDLQTSR
jgi:tetratricopeptide (TPR) repeat protein